MKEGMNEGMYEGQGARRGEWLAREAVVRMWVSALHGSVAGVVGEAGHISRPGWLYCGPTATVNEGVPPREAKATDGPVMEGDHHGSV